MKINDNSALFSPHLHMSVSKVSFGQCRWENVRGGVFKYKNLDNFLIPVIHFKFCFKLKMSYCGQLVRGGSLLGTPTDQILREKGWEYQF
jgi:hypothetical protein